MRLGLGSVTAITMELTSTWRLTAMTRLFAALAAIAVLNLAPVARASDYEGETQAAAMQSDIVDTAIASGKFTTLVAAVQAAGLVDTLRGEGPFTVFAPTDDAFALLPDGTVDSLLADPGTLSDVLLYHVVAGSLTAADVSGMSRVRAADGKWIPISSSDDGVMIGSAHVVVTDLTASNGVIHVIDAVLLPPAD